MLTSYARRHETGTADGFIEHKYYLTRILLKSAFSFGGRVIVGIVVIGEMSSSGSTSAHVAKVS